MASPILVNQNAAGERATLQIASFPALTRVNFVTRYAFQDGGNGGNGSRVEGPYFRIYPMSGKDIVAKAQGDLGVCADSPTMNPIFDTKQDYEGLSLAGLGPITLGVEERFYEIDAARGASFVCSVPISVEATTTAEGTWAWDLYASPIPADQDRMTARLIQTRYISPGSTRVLRVPRGCHRFAIYGNLAAMFAGLEDTPKAGTDIQLPVPTNAAQWGQYHPVCNAPVWTFQAAAPNGLAPGVFINWEIELP